ncbi:hypothetical protein QJ850_gp917 [Acanthamoeba polyphaga mimivirus]|uniref:Uncharacterized protein n=1 Tax=Acanthamoeba polyphaga mimivirus Kroon TaxID=3069720 RepID=A0A0G2Y7I8_9VIRU|nr:hypothetical protein QJ850_gp917 [Acanthamoeba polyphaga mimivirus]AKI79782.1 hypothetical protein [Acanthamoeba polyphaga mimivirus Kroon]
MENLYVVTLTWKYGDINNKIEGIFSERKKAVKYMKNIAKKFVKTLENYRLIDLTDSIILEPKLNSDSELSDYNEGGVIYNYEMTKVGLDKIFIDKKS